MRLEVKPSTDRAATLRRLAPAERHSVDGASLAEATEAAQLLDVIEDGRPTGALAVEVRGRVATIKAAAGDGRSNYAALAAVEHLAGAAGVRLLAMFTRRGGLIAALTRRGYRIRSVELEKDLTQ